MINSIKWPHDLQAEKALISCLILENLSFEKIVDLELSQEDFHDATNGKIFNLIDEHLKIGGSIDYLILQSKLRSIGHDCSDDFLINILSNKITSTFIEEYGKVVKEKSLLRKLMKTNLSLLELCQKESLNADELVSQAETELFKMITAGKKSQIVSITTLMKKVLKDLENENRNPGDINGLPTGFSGLDRLLLGMRPGNLIIIGARPGIGKTAIALNIANNVLFSSGLPVMIYSLEMMEEELALRMLSAKAEVKSRVFRTKDYKDMDLRNIANTVKAFNQLPLYINDNAAVTFTQLRSQARKVKAEEGLGLIVVDYIQIMRPIDRKVPREQQVSELSRSFKELAKELEIPIIVLAQINRDSSKSESSGSKKRPAVSQLRESGALEQDADIVMLLHRDEDIETNEVDLIVGKNRAGQRGTIKMTWHGEIFKFKEAEYKESKV